MEFAIWVVHVLVAMALVGLVLLQHGKGADMGAAFGSGASGSLFGASGSANFLSRTTAALAALFFLTSMSLTYFAGRSHAPVIAKPVALPVQPAAAPASPAATPNPPAALKPAASKPAASKPAAPATPPVSSDKSGAIPK